MTNPIPSKAKTLKGILLLLGAASLATVTTSCGSMGGSYPSDNPDPRVDTVLEAYGVPSVNAPMK